VITFGTDEAGASALTDAQLIDLEVCRADVPMAVVEIAVKASGGTPAVTVHRRTGTTNTALVSSALATASAGAIACSKTTAVTGLDGATTCTNTLQNVSVSAGHWIGVTSGTASTAARVSVAVTMVEQ
jgi:hypothetical protein